MSKPKTKSEAEEAEVSRFRFNLLSSSELIDDFGGGDSESADRVFKKSLLLPSTKFALLMLDKYGAISYKELREHCGYDHAEADEAMNELKQAIRTRNRKIQLNSLEYDDETRTARIAGGMG